MGNSGPSAAQMEANRKKELEAMRQNSEREFRQQQLLMKQRREEEEEARKRREEEARAAAQAEEKERAEALAEREAGEEAASDDIRASAKKEAKSMNFMRNNYVQIRGQ